jgi:DNA-3-methyladenine glycosylase II
VSPEENAHRNAAAVADPEAREFLRKADPLLAQVIDAHLARVQERFGGHIPSPAELLEADPHELRASGMSTRKGATLRALAERFVDGRLSEEALVRMTDDEIEAALTEVPGVGPWTAHGFLIFALDRPDVLLSGDLALRRAVERAYGLDHLPSEDEMVRLAERWRPYRSLAVGYLFASELEKGT